MQYFVGLLIFVLGYTVSHWLLSKVPAVAPVVDVLSIALGVLGALLYVGAL